MKLLEKIVKTFFNILLVLVVILVIIVSINFLHIKE